MNLPPFSIAFSDIDARCFNRRVAYARYPNSEEDVKAILSFCRFQNIELCLVRCSAASISTVQKLGSYGFCLMDTVIDWYADSRLIEMSHTKRDHPIVRTVVVSEKDAICQIAEAAFKSYRGHYANDPGLPLEKTVQIYPDWAAREVDQRSKEREVLVVEYKQVVAGFLTLSFMTPDQARVGVLAIHPEFHGRGLMRPLLQGALNWTRLVGASSLSIESQLINYRVHHVCSTMRFILSATDYQLHGWFPTRPDISKNS